MAKAWVTVSGSELTGRARVQGPEGQWKGLELGVLRPASPQPSGWGCFVQSEVWGGCGDQERTMVPPHSRGC